MIGYPKQVVERLQLLLGCVWPRGGIGALAVADASDPNLSRGLELVDGIAEWQVFNFLQQPFVRPSPSQRVAVLVVSAGENSPEFESLLREIGQPPPPGADNSTAMLLLLVGCQHRRHAQSPEVQRLMFWDYL